MASGKPKRGRPTRAGVAASRRVELRVTLTEWRELKAAAERGGLSVADYLRLAAVDNATEEGTDAPVIAGPRLQRFIAGQKSRRDGDSEP